jgi:hypothetical protein
MKCFGEANHYKTILLYSPRCKPKRRKGFNQCCSSGSDDKTSLVNTFPVQTNLIDVRLGDFHSVGYEHYYLQ